MNYLSDPNTGNHAYKSLSKAWVRVRAPVPNVIEQRTSGHKSVHTKTYSNFRLHELLPLHESNE
jgi:hypothetical protein